jgi:hypothetical protein
MKDFIKYLLSASIISVALLSCQKQEITIPPAVGKIVASEPIGVFSIFERSDTYKVYFGLTSSLPNGGTVRFTISSRTAQLNREFFINKTRNEIDFAPGAVLDSLIITGDPAFYASDRKDTLRISVQSGSIPAAIFDTTFQVVLQKPCREIEDFNLPALQGVYSRTFEGSYGPYPSEISNLVATSSTTATGVLSNIYDSGIEATFNITFATAGQFTVSVPEQSTGFFTSNNEEIFIRSTNTNPGEFSFCNQQFSFNLVLFTATRTVDTFNMSLRR